MSDEHQMLWSLALGLNLNWGVFNLQPVRSGPVSNLKNVNVSKKRKTVKGRAALKRSDSKSSNAIAVSTDVPLPETIQTDKDSQTKSKDSSTLDDINPYVIGQRSRWELLYIHCFCFSQKILAFWFWGPACARLKFWPEDQCSATTRKTPEISC